MRSRALSLVLAAGLLAAVAAAPARADIAAPVVIPASAGTPQANVDTCWPASSESKCFEQFPPEAMAVTPPGSVFFNGNLTTYPLVWDDTGSGIPSAPNPSWNYRYFEQPGVYHWRCAVLTTYCGIRQTTLVTGDVYVVGPRARVKATMLDMDNTNPPVTYLLDAGASSVTDVAPYSITEYSFDVDGDGLWDHVGPLPTTTAALPPGDNPVTVRVVDDHVPARSNTTTIIVQIPKVVSGYTPPPSLGGGTGGANSQGSGTFRRANIRVVAARSIRTTVLRRKGLRVDVKGVRAGDRLSYTLQRVRGKRQVARRVNQSSSSQVAMRLRPTRRSVKLVKVTRGRTLKAKLVVQIRGTDGFVLTRTRRVTLRG